MSDKKKEIFSTEERLAFLVNYYSESIYGTLHIWTHNRIWKNGWFDYAWWFHISNFIAVDMKSGNGEWPLIKKWLKKYGLSKKKQDLDRGAILWWKAHNTSLNNAVDQYKQYWHEIPVLVRERSSLMIEGANGWKIDALKPWKIPSKWMQIFM